MVIAITIVLVVAVFWLAWSNGANDNFKGVATLYGSETTGFRRALLWATVATVLGSAFSVFLAERLVKQFSGAGIVPIEQIDATWLIAVSGGGAITMRKGFGNLHSRQVQPLTRRGRATPIRSPGIPQLA